MGYNPSFFGHPLLDALCEPSCSLTRIKDLLGKDPLHTLQTTRSTSGFSALHIASTYCTNPSVTKMFLDLGADVNDLASRGQTPLHMCLSISQQVDVIRALLDAGANPNTLGGVFQTRHGVKG